MVLLCTPKAPGHNTLQLTVTHNGATGVTLLVGQQSSLTYESVLSKLRAAEGTNQGIRLCALYNSEDTHLAGVLASLHVSSTEHGLSDHAGVGVVTVLSRQDGDVQALQPVTVSSFGDAEPETQ